MNKEKTSFILHEDSLEILETMNKEERGEFIYAIYRFRIDGKLDDDLSRVLKTALHPFIKQFARDDEKWNKSKDKKSVNGRIGNLSKYHNDLFIQFKNEELTLEEAEKVAKGRKRSQGDTKVAKVAVNVNDNVNVNVNVNKNNNVKEKDKKEIIPDYIKADLWNEFLTIRLKLKAVNSDLAIKGILNKLERWNAKGHDANDMILNSIENSWKGVFEPKATKYSKTSGSTQVFENTIRNAHNVINRHNQKKQ